MKQLLTIAGWTFLAAFIITFPAWLALGAAHIHVPLGTLWGLTGSGLLLLRLARGYLR